MAGEGIRSAFSAILEDTNALPKNDILCAPSRPHTKTALSHRGSTHIFLGSHNDAPLYSHAVVAVKTLRCFELLKRRY